MLGFVHYYGDGDFRCSYRLARGNFIAAIKRNCFKVAVTLGYMFYFGKGMRADFAKAFEYFTIAANLSYMKGYFYLGRMYMDGHHVLKADKKALEHFKKALDLGDSEAKSYIEKLNKIKAEANTKAAADVAPIVERDNSACRPKKLPIIYGAAYGFMPTLDRDSTTGIIWFFQTITAMPQYSKYSLEGLRLQDFQRFEEPVRLATVTGDSDSDFLVVENASDVFPEETVGSDTVDNQAKEAQGRDVKAEEGTNKLNTEMEAAQIQAEDMVKEGSSHQAAYSTLVSDSNINEDNSKDTTSEDGFVVVVNPENDNDEVASAPGEEFEQYSKTEEDDIIDATSGNDSIVVIIHDNENVEGGSVSSQEVDKWDIVLNGFKKITESMEDVKQMYINFKGMPRREEQSNQSATTSSNTNDSRDIEATIRDMQARLDKVERDNNRRTKVLVFW